MNRDQVIYRPPLTGADLDRLRDCLLFAEKNGDQPSTQVYAQSLRESLRDFRAYEDRMAQWREQNREG